MTERTRKFPTIKEIKANQKPLTPEEEKWLMEQEYHFGDLTNPCNCRYCKKTDCLIDRKRDPFVCICRLDEMKDRLTVTQVEKLLQFETLEQAFEMLSILGENGLSTSVCPVTENTRREYTVTIVRGFHCVSYQPFKPIKEAIRMAVQELIDNGTIKRIEEGQ